MIEEIEALLKRTMGLDADSIGRSAIESALKERRSASGISALSAYLQHLRASPVEQQALIDAVVVNETWFFRASEAFDAMTTIVLGRWRQSGAPQRLLSLPCSTGEEPYSMTMALLSAGMPADMFRIDGIDISTRAIAAAQTAVYGKNSFRERNLIFRDRYFEETPAGFRLNDAVRRQVIFTAANLMDPAAPLSPSRYDIVFCRNMLIYFDPPTQDIAIGMLSRLLVADGLLFVGAAEASLPPRQDFTAMRIPMAAAFRRGKVAVETPAVVRPVPVKPRAAAVQAPAPRIRTPVAPPPSPPAAIVGPEAMLDMAQRLADAGRVQEAQTLAADCLAQHGPNSRTFYLLALLSDVTGDEDRAEAFYRKTLYLDPHHGEALTHLAMLHTKRGNIKGANALQARLRRTSAI